MRSLTSTNHTYLTRGVGAQTQLQMGRLDFSSQGRTMFKYSGITPCLWASRQLLAQRQGHIPVKFLDQ
jgi:hypothetical protein